MTDHDLMAVEGFIEEQFLDSLEVVVRKPALVADDTPSSPETLAAAPLAVSGSEVPFHRCAPKRYRGM